MLTTFDQLESNVRSYCRRWPTVFATAQGPFITDEHGSQYLDFFAGAGVLGYGHNNPLLIEVALEHLRSGKLLHSLDTFTVEKRDFLETFEATILRPRQLDMLVQMVGPTGATAVEAALQLAQRLTGKRGVLGYQGGYHGMTYRAASVSESMAPRPVVAHLGDFVALPFVEHLATSDLELLEATLREGVNGTPIGVVLLEPTQGEGGARAFDPAYLAEVRRITREHGVLVIADEIQAGVGRTGPFFSFEGTALDPDIVCVSKAISGLGLPMALNLIRRGLDDWRPGEFSGTFRGNNLAFATSATMLRHYWSDDHFAKNTERQGQMVRDTLTYLAETHGKGAFKVNGNGMLAGLHVGDTDLASRVSALSFERNLIVETCGRDDQVVKILPTLIMSDEELNLGLERLTSAFDQACAER